MNRPVRSTAGSGGRCIAIDNREPDTDNKPNSRKHAVEEYRFRTNQGARISTVEKCNERSWNYT